MPIGRRTCAMTPEPERDADRLRVIRDHRLLAEVALPAALSLGRLPDNDVVLDDDGVSGHHGRIERRAQGFRFTDLGSTNGSIVAAGPTLRPGQSFDFAEDTQFLLGSTVIDVRVVRRRATAHDEPALVPAIARLYLPVPAGWVARAAPGPRVLLGRAEDCTVVVRHPSVSAHHAELLGTPQGWQLRDLGSANGTRLGVQRAKGPVALPGDCQILLGDAELLFSDCVSALPAISRLLAALVADERLTRAQARVARHELHLRHDLPAPGDLRDFLLGRGWVSPGGWVEAVARAAQSGGDRRSGAWRVAWLATALLAALALLFRLACRPG